MDRRDKALEFVDLSGRGLEIGPSYNPLVTKASGARIETVDHADRETLVAKYTTWGLPQDKLDSIEEVDHQWAGGSLLEVIEDRKSYDYIIASHFIEHTVDLVSFLQDCEALLTDDGRLALVVPDKRYCFDRFQPLSTVGDVVDAFHAVNSFHTAGALLDHQAYGCKRGESIAWSSAETGPLGVQFPNMEGAAEVIAAGLSQDAYHDIHHWKFTPASFDLLIRDLAALGYHQLGVVGSAGTEGFEFYVTLGKGVEAAPVDRVAALVQIEAELAAVTTVDDRLSSAPATNTDLERETSHLRSEIEKLHASTSWRVTAPLRKATTAVRRLRSR
jgi:hypothetical protein